MKRNFILILAVFIASCILPDIECQPDLPCSRGDLQYVEYSPPEPTVPDPVLPSKPMPSFTQMDGSVLIEWPACDNATSYDLHYSDGTTTYHINNVSSPYSHAGLVNSNTYYYVIGAVNSDGETISLEYHATPGIVDNLDGTISIIADGLTYPKCSQTLSGNSYDPLTGQCGLSDRMIPCDVNYYCDDGYVINEASMTTYGTYSQSYYSCKDMAFAGGGWRLPSISELENLTILYNQSPELFGYENYYYWSGSGYMDQPQYGWAQAVYDITSGSYTTPTRMNEFPAYVVCVR